MIGFELSDQEKNSESFLILSGSGGMIQLFLMIWSLLLGLFLTLGGSFLGWIAWIKGF